MYNNFYLTHAKVCISNKSERIKVSNFNTSTLIIVGGMEYNP